DGVEHARRGARDRERALVAEPSAQPAERRPERLEEAAVAPARAEAAELRLDEGHLERRAPLLQRQRRPQARVAAADDRHVGVDRPGERLPRWVGRRLLEPPGGPVARGYRRRSSSHASASTPPRMPAIWSNSSWPATSGGEICTTGSPRSSARQMSPRSN